MSVTPSEFGLLGFAFPAGGASACDYPDEDDVRSGVVYADGSMTGTLSLGTGTEPDGPHSPADMVRHIFVDLGKAAVAGLEPWPAYVDNEPALPDNVITVYDTTGIDQGRSMIDGELLGPDGIQVRVRSTTHVIGWAKALELQTAMAKDIYDTVVRIGDSVYLVHCLSKIGVVLRLGKDTTSKRSLFTVNAVVNWRQLS